jgi:hypothetical protein
MSTEEARGAPAGTNQMTAATRERVLADLASGRDEFSPAFLYSVTSTSLLLAAAAGLIDPTLLARRELASRGLDADGTWVGFDRAAQIHGVAR